MRVIQESAPCRSIEDLDKEAMEAVESALALFPNLPAANLLKELLQLVDPDLLVELDAVLRAKYFLSMIRARRAKDRAERTETAWLSPQIRDAVLTLPKLIPIGDGETVFREDLEFAHTRLYLKVLDQQQRTKKDPRREAIKTIQSLWPRARKRPLQMTLTEVDTVYAHKKGLV